MSRSPVPEPTLLHVLDRSDWESLASAKCWSPPSLRASGFIHLCLPEQLEGVLRRWFAGRGDLVVLELDPSRLEADLEWAELPHGTFPHLLGPLNLDAISAIREGVGPPCQDDKG